MNAAALSNPETVKAFAAVVELLANPHEHKKAVEELKKLVEASHQALIGAQAAQANADVKVKEAERLVRLAESVKAQNGRDIADISVRREQLDDHAGVLDKRQAALAENERRSQDEFDGREKKMVEREREVKARLDAAQEREETVQERETALLRREADITAAEARLREVMGITRNFSLEAETGRPFARMGGA